MRARADQARSAGREPLATVLDNRAQVLIELLDVLPQRERRLAELADHCAQQGAA